MGVENIVRNLQKKSNVHASKKPKCIDRNIMNLQPEMNVDLDVKTLEYIYESVQFRLENDNHLMYHPDIRKDLEDMLAEWEDEYL